VSHHIEVTRFFTRDLDGKSPYEAIEWEERTAKLTNFKGEVIFEQQGVRVPKFWSVTATNITVSKYFYGKLGTPQRETSVEQLVRRITRSITLAGIKQGYFAEGSEDARIFEEELAYLLLNQYFAFNSPVWFNVGLDQLEPNAKAGSWHWTTEYERPQVLFQKSGYHSPQCSACFIQSVEDSMEGIMRLATNEAMLFKFGSGTGTNFSSLRSSKENVSGGGVASGPLSFMKGLDAFAGVIKSGGKTRRAAKMAILNVSHPDIVEFIDCKLTEEKKAQALMREGYDGSSGPDSPAYSSIFYQNANNSVRVTDNFMSRAAEGNVYNTFSVSNGEPVATLDARQVLRKIAQATWECGDPGLQFDDTINKWHTSPVQGRINASNPCSEYMFLDDSACNLGSFNLLKFLFNGKFQGDQFKRAVILATIAQDILVDYSGYPTEEIAKNSHDYRPLGLGYANLGALLMAMGMAYDSPDGRALAAVITAIMTGQAYATSAFMARVLRPIEEANFSLHEKHRNANTGCCPGWSANKKAFHSVIKQHQAALNGIDYERVKDRDLLLAVETSWDEAVSEGKQYGYRNSQVTVLAPTGTIGFLMDCDTTGIEPELSLIKYKKLVGGGMLKLVNEQVKAALKALGKFSDETIELMEKYVDAHGTLEGSGIRPEFLPVFDTAFKPAEGTRSIHYIGHIQMMAAVQPFLSGAISKTVNLPSDATVDDIYDAYLQSWKLGLKAVAIYRDGSKSNQPVVVKKEDGKDVPIGGLCSQDSLITILEHLEPGSPKAELVKALQDTFGEYLMPVVVKAPVNEFAGPPLAVRHRLPDTRKALTHKFSIAGHDGYLTVGLYENGRPGEIFIAMAKEGSTLSGMMDSFALTFSIALQHGTPLETLVSKLAHTRFEPSGWTGNPDVGYAKSIMDYVARWLEMQFLKPQQGKLFENVPLSPATVIEDSAPAAPVNVAQAMSSMMSFGDSPACPECGAITVRSGSCYKCMECGSTTGCS
jgi:ribonucleoside-diphosphate reductase alpha chain